MLSTEIDSIIAPTHNQRVIVGLQGTEIRNTGKYMAKGNRNVTVLFSLITAMTVGALVLMALDNRHPITANAFSLTSYLRLDPAEKMVKNTLQVSPGNWNQVEVYYSRTDAGNADELALLTDLATGTKAQFHFVIGNGNGAQDGAIQPGEYWKLQRLCNDRGGVVRICVISDGTSQSVTDCQVNRTHALVESLMQTFEISPRNIRYPASWEM